MGQLSTEQINGALNKVIDPHMKVSINSIGMVRSIDISNTGEINIAISFPCIGCPARELIHSDIKQQVSKLAGVSQVKVRDEWVDKWDPADISEEARTKAKDNGYLL